MDAIEEIEKRIDYGKPVKRRIKRNTNAVIDTNSYMQKQISLQDTPFLFFPPGKEFLFLGIYFATLPYITGLLFLFFYISEGKPAVFGSISINSDANFFLIWCVGYEILAAIIVTWIVKNAIMFSISNSQRNRQRNPKKRRRYP